MPRFQDRTVIVTGGAGGIGGATCRRVGAEGARVAVFDLNLEAAEKVAARDAGMIVLDHAASVPSSGNADDDAYYARFEVPDDLVW